MCRTAVHFVINGKQVCLTFPESAFHFSRNLQSAVKDEARILHIEKRSSGNIGDYDVLM